MAQRTSVCVWRATPAVIVALDERFGEPVDAYVNGSQTWLRDDGPGGITLEWRLHPVAGYRKPRELDTYEVFASVALAQTAPNHFGAAWRLRCHGSGQAQVLGLRGQETGGRRQQVGLGCA